MSCMYKALLSNNRVESGDRAEVIPWSDVVWGVQASKPYEQPPPIPRKGVLGTVGNIQG